MSTKTKQAEKETIKKEEVATKMLKDDSKKDEEAAVKETAKESARPSAKKTFYTAVGRRKTSIARVKLTAEKGDIMVNGKVIHEYFPSELSKTIYLEPFRTTNTIGKWSGTITLIGGGRNSQLYAYILGVSRMLSSYDERFKTILRKRGFLTRDPRAKERKKPGLMGARKVKQSPKR